VIDPEKLQQMMQQAQSMQQRMQESLAAQQVEGQAGGGMVSLTMNGAYEVVSLTIDPAVVDKADVSMLEDLVRAALNDATSRVEEVRLDQARNMAGQMGIPGLF
jgi:nucleoid-associated protein EbfC